MTAQGIEAEGRNTEGGSVHESPVDKVDAPPSLPPTGEGLPEEIVKAIEEHGSAKYAEGYFYDGEYDARPVKARTTLDATILHHLSAARARAERAEKALEPFADFVSTIEQQVHDARPVVVGGCGRHRKMLIVGDVRRAAAAISSVAEEA